MLEKHTTKDKKTMLIAQMDDQHLTNMIALILRQVGEIRGLTNDHLSDYERTLYDIPKVSEEEVAMATRLALQKLYPYLAEAYLRGLEGPRKMLVETLGREAAVPYFHVASFPELSRRSGAWDQFDDLCDWEPD